MASLKLFHYPGACSRVTMTALEHIGCPYEDELVSLPEGEQSSPKFRAINPHGRVPALLVDGKLLTENAAILVWLNTTFPQAGLLPVPSNDWQGNTPNK